MIADRKGRFFGHVGLNELCAPPPVVRMDNIQDNVMQKTGQDHFFIHASLQGARGTLLIVGYRAEPVLEEIEQCRLLGHRLERG